MLNKKKWIALVGFTLVLCGCGLMQQDAVLYSPANPPPVRVITPRFAHFEFGFMNRYRISHEYLFGPGVRECRYAIRTEKSAMEDGQVIYYIEKVGDFFEGDGHIYQYGYSTKTGGWVPVEKDIYVLGQPSTSNLGGKPFKYINFRSICSDWVGGYDFVISLRKSAVQSIEQSITKDIELMKKFYNDATWEAPIEVMRHGNQWTVFKSRNPAIYTADATDDWYLPIGDGQYYYLVSFSYKSAVQKAAPADYAIYRAVFEHILDSFKIEPLAVQ